MIYPPPKESPILIIKAPILSPREGLKTQRCEQRSGDSWAFRSRLHVSTAPLR